MNCEICKENTLLDEHHIQSKSFGGSNHKSNIANICPNCHRLVHKGLLIIEGRFDSTSGSLLIWRKYGDDSVTGVKDPDVFLSKDSEYLKELYLKRKENDS